MFGYNTLVVAMVSQKGGAGKSTLAANLAAYAVGKDAKTAIIDLDPQASLSTWHSLRDKEDITLFTLHPPLLTKKIAELKRDLYELIIIDTPPHNSTAAANAINESDITLMPVRPSTFDLMAIQATFDLLGDNLGGVIINAVPSGTSIEESATQFIKDSGVRVLSTVGQRIAFQHSANAGQGVVEYESKGKAAKEITTIWREIGELV